MDNSSFLKVLGQSFRDFIISGTSRSTAKLKILHGSIAKDLSERLEGDYSVKSQGFADDHEGSIDGRYMNKRVDITVYKGLFPVAGLAVKFIMQNYSQNSNNYFENMLGETANIRSNGHPYFQIFIILDKLPYYKRDGFISRWETFTKHNMEKYCQLSNDNTNVYMHTPDKTLLYIVHIPENENIATLKEYRNFYLGQEDLQVKLSETPLPVVGDELIFNDYEKFISKVCHRILSL